jgi:hypothetical protein
VAVKWWAKWETAQNLACLIPALVSIRIAFSSCTVALICLNVLLYLNPTMMTEEKIEKTFDKSLQRVNDNF